MYINFQTHARHGPACQVVVQIYVLGFILVVLDFLATTETVSS